MRPGRQEGRPDVLGLNRISWLAAGLKAGYFVPTLFELTSAAALFSRAQRGSAS